MAYFLSLCDSNWTVLARGSCLDMPLPVRFQGGGMDDNEFGCNSKPTGPAAQIN